MYRRLLIAIMLLMFSAVGISAQEQEAIPISYNNEKPSFNGADCQLFTQWVKEHQVYPREALELGLQGRVTIRFTITEKGELENVEVVRGIHKSLDEASLQIIKSSAGLWTPGKDHYRKPCSTTFLFPVIWQLPSD